jgi:hypothetical protein
MNYVMNFFNYRELEISDLMEFTKWAIGDNYQDIISSEEIRKRWNKLHSDQYHIGPDEIVSESVMKMVALYRKSKEKKYKDYDVYVNDNCYSVSAENHGYIGDDLYLIKNGVNVACFRKWDFWKVNPSSKG